MRLARPRFTVRRMMVGVAVAYLCALGVSPILRQRIVMGEIETIPLMILLPVGYGLAAVHEPLMLLAVWLALWATAPIVQGGFTVQTTAVILCGTGWIIGAPAGWIVRAFRKPDCSPAPIDSIIDGPTDR